MWIDCFVHISFQRLLIHHKHMEFDTGNSELWKEFICWTITILVSRWIAVSHNSQCSISWFWFFSFKSLLIAMPIQSIESIDDQSVFWRWFNDDPCQVVVICGRYCSDWSSCWIYWKFTETKTVRANLLLSWRFVHWLIFSIIFFSHWIDCWELLCSCWDLFDGRDCSM